GSHVEFMLGRTWGAAVRPHLGPAFTEQVAQLPASLDTGTQKLLVCRLPVPTVLAEAEQRLCQRPTSMK
nr:hypothetical protein [Tanacetum cinerariifolium]